MSFVLLRLVFSFVCACLHIISYLRLAISVFRGVLNFFCSLINVNLLILCVCYIVAGADFCRLNEFFEAVSSRLPLIG